jgi:nitrogen regulatory protein PII
MSTMPGAHIRKRIEIIVEHPTLRLVESILEACGVHVFTVLEGREGRGLHGRWDDQNLADAFDQRVVIAVTTDEVAARVCVQLQDLFKRYPGVVLLSDIEVLRAERF